MHMSVSRNYKSSNLIPNGRFIPANRTFTVINYILRKVIIHEYQSFLISRNIMPTFIIITRKLIIYRIEIYILMPDCQHNVPISIMLISIGNNKWHPRFNINSHGNKIQTHISIIVIK